MHNVSSREKVQGLALEEIRGSATARDLPGIGTQVPSRTRRCSAVAGRDLGRGDGRNAAMKRLIGDISPRYQTLLRSAAWGVLIVLLLASLPFLFGPMSRGLDWIVSAFPQAMRGALM